MAKGAPKAYVAQWTTAQAELKLSARLQPGAFSRAGKADAGAGHLSANAVHGIDARVADRRHPKIPKSRAGGPRAIPGHRKQHQSRPVKPVPAGSGGSKGAGISGGGSRSAALPRDLLKQPAPKKGNDAHMTAEAAVFTCSICGEPSRDICVYCTKDACANHRCERCKRCSDCCECEVPLSAAERSRASWKRHSRRSTMFMVHPRAPSRRLSGLLNPHPRNRRRANRPRSPAEYGK